MSLKQIEKLYKKMLSFSGDTLDGCRLNARVRSEIFHKIMDDTERLQKKIKNCKKESKDYKQIDKEIRLLLMKEIQIIIDDYIVSKQNGNLERWEKMYGDINMYIRNFYSYRDSAAAEETEDVVNGYGFYEEKHS